MWNKIVSRRIKEFGLKPIVGDLVLVDGDDYQEVVDQEGTVVASDEFPKRPRKKEKKAAALAAREARNTAKTTDTSEAGDTNSAEEKDGNEKETDCALKPDIDDSAADETGLNRDNKGEEEEGESAQKDVDDSLAKPVESSMEVNAGESTTEENPEGFKPCPLIEYNQKAPAVRVITEEDLENVKIEDIVLPLPGHNVIYPNNVIKEWYEELLAVDGLSFTAMKQNVR